MTKVDLDDVTGVKAERRVPERLHDCHTAIVGDYFIEGHVPAAALEKLLRERPDVAGLALPGMPTGSPGMPGVKEGPFVVLQVHRDGSISEFGRY